MSKTVVTLDPEWVNTLRPLDNRPLDHFRLFVLFIGIDHPGRCIYQQLYCHGDRDCDSEHPSDH
jgi:hypothetical protein